MEVMYGSKMVHPVIRQGRRRMTDVFTKFTQTFSTKDQKADTSAKGPVKGVVLEIWHS